MQLIMDLLYASINLIPDCAKTLFVVQKVQTCQKIILGVQNVQKRPTLQNGKISQVLYY